MKKTILIGIFLIGIVLISGCYKSEIEETEEYINAIDNFCMSLELEDYWWDCSEWENSNVKWNTTGIPKPYYAVCDFESPGLVGCDINYLLYEKMGYIGERVYVEYACRGDTLEEAFNECKERLPKELENITIIKPIENEP